jgi:hypothetical protein
MEPSGEEGIRQGQMSDSTGNMLDARRVLLLTSARIAVSKNHPILLANPEEPEISLRLQLL